jgi:uncharacterized protein YwqG
MGRAKIRDLIHSNDLSRHAESIQGFMKNAINLQPILPAKGEPVGIGRSKFGGLPDLPPTMDWPMWKGQPLSLIGQFNMAEVAPLDSDKILPQAGLLYFFYEANEQTWGFDPAERGAWRTLYFDGTESQLSRKTKPPFQYSGSVPESDFNECSITFSKGVSLPGPDSSLVDSLSLTGKECDNYEEFLEDVAELNGDGPAYHHLLGYPQQIQGEMELECQLVSHGVYCGDPSGYRDSSRSQLEEGAREWRLLLQVDSDDDVGMMWGDVGRIYFWIRDRDLKSRNFDNVWFVLQCY